MKGKSVKIASEPASGTDTIRLSSVDSEDKGQEHCGACQSESEEEESSDVDMALTRKQIKFLQEERLYDEFGRLDQFTYQQVMSRLKF